MPNQRNYLLALGLSLIIMLGFQYFYEIPRAQEQAERQRAEQQLVQEQTRQQTKTFSSNGKQPNKKSNVDDLTEQDAGIVPDAPYQIDEEQSGGLLPGSGALAEPLLNAVGDEARAGLKRQLDSGARVAIVTDRLQGSILLLGGVIDDLILTDYRETLTPDADYIHMLAPRFAAKPYFAYFGWRSDDSNLSLPGANTQWSQKSKAASLTPDQPLILEWDNGQGLIFERTIRVNDDYMFEIADRVINHGTDAVEISAFGVIERRYLPPVTGFFILHEGMLGVFEKTLSEVDYDSLMDESSGEIVQRSVGGWMGFTDKYWLSALIPDQAEPFTGTFRHDLQGRRDRFSSYFTIASQNLAQGKEITANNRLFAGPKQVKLLDRYRDYSNIDRFDLAIDFGWFYFLTKPIFLTLVFFSGFFGNFGAGILLLTVLIKTIIFPLAYVSYRSMALMRRLQPEMTKLRDRFGQDKMKLNQEMMALYKREKVNPLAGCLPMIPQIIVFFALYKVLFVTIEMRHTPFIGWIDDLSAPDPTTLFNLFGLIPWDPPAFLYLGAWPLIMGLTMYIQQKLNPQPTDPVQAKIFAFLPFIFTILLAQFAAGLVIYWAWNNFLSIIQQYAIMRRMGVKVGWGTTKTPS